MKTERRGNSMPVSLPANHGIFNNRQDSLSGALKGCLGSLDGACIEKLLLHCAGAIESDDVTLAQQVMWVLNNVASSVGDPNQRLTSWFLRALICRVSRICPAAMNFHGTTTLQRIQTRSMTVTQLAGYVDLIPWHRFGFRASNSCIFKAVEGFPRVHILDFSITHCMQWPTLIDALAKRPEGPPSVRITVPSCRPPVPPLLNVSSDEVGLRLANFAKSRDVPFEFHVIKGSSSCINASDDHHDHISLGEYSSSNSNFHLESLMAQLSPSMLHLRDDEALVINCQNWLRYLPVDPDDDPRSGAARLKPFRNAFLEMIKGLNPCIVTVVDEDLDLDVSSSLMSRITTAFNYLWIPFDALETLPKDNPQRMEYEADIGHKIENILCFEGLQRIERLESGVKLSQRMKNANFISVPFCEDTVKEVKFLLDEHASGWGMKREGDMLVLTWKGHSSVFASAWVPSGQI
ncbi:PREDICTED: scarecrow-like protein 32 [Nelumbo nucifera]|uniref:Scarecrow-like protein 32 n=2 Tax=Nelumbo nucifera TaxID=4432 RepID=A0A822XVJ8_NELNU|nr:PREDICTED: scarecrow-like protein 32 [Nelumbo nucifera]DAD23191.1 TPA_asm: hypothetical protein HUJ06_024654 [Nelumbo nucifera]